MSDAVSNEMKDDGAYYQALIYKTLFEGIKGVEVKILSKCGNPFIVKYNASWYTPEFKLYPIEDKELCDFVYSYLKGIAK